jgi:hypothetical protein
MYWFSENIIHLAMTIAVLETKPKDKYDMPKLEL